MRIRLTRRQLALVLLATVGGAPLAYWSVARRDPDAVDLDLPPLGAFENPSFEVFLALCRIVLARDDLDAKLAQRIYRVLLDEPWGQKHIATSYSALRQAIIQSGTGRHRDKPAPVAVLQAGERWFVSHLLTTWYLGIYYHRERPTQRVAYDNALMYDAVRGLIPRPFVGQLDYGRWSEPPEPVDR
jgi:hypothetical protein